MNEKKYTIVSAHHCAPAMGSEHAVGWNIVSRLARYRPILLITQDNEYRAAIERGVTELQAEGCEILAFFVRHNGRTDGRRNTLRIHYYLTYIAYQWRVYRLAKQLVKVYDVCAAHHLNIVGFREPGFLWKLGVPFIWGPVGGLVFTESSLYDELPIKSRVHLRLTEFITKLQFALSTRVRAAYLATQGTGGAFIAATADIGVRFQKRFGGSTHWIPETGASTVSVTDHANPAQRDSTALRLLWVGALIDRKPLGLLLDAISTIPSHRDKIHLTIVGDGDSRARYEKQAQDYAVRADFVGWQSHEETQAHFKSADLFVLLSVKDLNTNVVFEALTHALPVLCLDHHGYADIVNDQCGIKIKISDIAQVRRTIADQLEKLCVDPSPLQEMSAAAICRAQAFSWDSNARAINALLPHIHHHPLNLKQ